MLNVERSHARELAAQRVRDPELLRLAPLAPYFPPDFAILPFGPARLAILCGNRREVLSSTIPLDLVKRILGLCDGTRAREEIATAVAVEFGGLDEAARNVDELVALLDRNGVLQDGSPGPQGGVHLRDPETERFWEQVCGADSVHRSRRALREAFDRFRVRVSGPEHLRQAAERAVRGAGLELDGAGACNGSVHDVSLVLYDDPAGLQLSNEDTRPGALTLFAGSDRDSFRLGPLVPAETASAVAKWLSGAWLASGRPVLSGHPMKEMWATITAARLFRLACGLERGRKFNAVEIFSRCATHEELLRRAVLVSPYVAVEAGSSAPNEALLVAAAQSGIEEPFSRHLSSRTYLMHYATKNRKLASGPAPAFFGAPAFFLPEAVVERQGTLSERLSLACKWAFGLDGGRRITPSGGDLRSAELLVNLPCATDLPAGLYRYRDTDHALERLGEVRASNETGLSESEPSFLIVSRLRRVARKYQDAAYKICGLDAGVCAAVLMQVGARLGMPLTVRTDLDMRPIERLLPLSFVDDRYLLSACLTSGTSVASEGPGAEPVFGPDPAALSEQRALLWVAALGRRPLAPSQPRAVPGEPQASLGGLADLGATLSARRAVRLLPPDALPCDTILELLAEAETGVARYVPGLARHIRIVAVDRARGRVFNRGAGLAGWRPGARDARIFWQGVPDMAPAMLVGGLEMGPLASAHGAAGYRNALQALGAGLHLAWLGACARGLQGTLLGGVFNEGMNACLPADSWRIAPIAGLAFGEAAPS
ncbi:hypothetical protein [Stappia sp.]|uniref:hypothetical protein n=1 Tax=Stappia sp. TaxID=1870903 RepID=UPI003A9A65BB